MGNLLKGGIIALGLLLVLASSCNCRDVSQSDSSVSKVLAESKINITESELIVVLEELQRDDRDMWVECIDNSDGSDASCEICDFLYNTSRNFER